MTDADERNKTKVIFMGTPEFARASLQALIEAGFDIPAVVSQPDRPQGRGNKIVYSPVKSYALSKGIRVMQPQRASEIAAKLAALEPDFIAVVAYGQILKPDVLSIPKKGCINVHASLLPLYRGASPIQCAIINGEKETGVTTMLMDEGMDTGPILLQQTTTIESYDTASTLQDRLAEIGADLLVHTLDAFDSITPQPQPVCEGAACAPILCRGHGAIDWERPADQLDNLVRGCECWPSAFTRHNGMRIIVWKAVPMPEEPIPEGAAPGTIIAISNENGIEIATGGGVLGVLELQREGKKRQGFEEFLRGYRLAPGDAFVTES